MTSAAFAWPACSGQWVSVPKGTTGGTLYSTGDLLFQCQTKTPPPTSTPTSTTSSSTATSGSAANATSSATGVGIASATQKQNQSQVATGGFASSDATAADNGNNSNNTTINEAKLPVSTAYAPPVVSLAACFKGYSAGAQGREIGLSFGGGKIDKNCRALQAALVAPNKLVFCKVYIRLQDIKAAGVTLQECMIAVTPTVVIPPQPLPPLPVPLPVTITVVLPSPPEYRTSFDVVAPKAKSCTLTKGTVRATVRQHKPCPVN